MEKYDLRMLDLTADNKVDENHNKLDKKSKMILSQLGIRFGGCTDKDKDCMHHNFNDYCPGEVKTSRQTGKETCRTCHFGFGTKKKQQEKGTLKARTFTNKQNCEGP